MTVPRECAEEYGRGFRFSELTRMVQFAPLLPEQAIVVTLSQQLRRSHLHALLPIKDPPWRETATPRCAGRNSGTCDRVM